MDGEGRTGRERKERLRARRDEAGMAQVSGWVPKDRRPYAREVLAALARGANSLPPDPEQAAALDAARADATVARTAAALAYAVLAEAEQREQAVAAELDAVHAKAGATREADLQIVAAAVARAEMAERSQEVAIDELSRMKATLALAQVEADQIRKTPGLKGYLVRRFILRLRAGT